MKQKPAPFRKWNTDIPFRNFYDKKLSGQLEKIFEEGRRLREEQSRSIKQDTVGIVIVFLVSCSLLFIVSNRLIIHALVFVPLGCVIAVVVIQARRLIWVKKETSEFKRTVVPQIVKYLDPSLEFHPDRMIPARLYELSGLFPQRCDKYDGEDLVSGFYRGVEVMFSELRTKYETESTDDEGNTTRTTHTIFDGVFFVADFHKNFKYKTYVEPNLAGMLFGVHDGFLKQFLSLDAKKLIMLENVEFEKEFAVYADDPVEARYILSPLLMERLLALRKRFACPLRIAFVDSCIFIAISTDTDFFELNSLYNFDFSVVKRCRQELEMFLKIVEELNLDRRIWSKQ